MNLPPIMYRGRFALLWHEVFSRPSEVLVDTVAGPRQEFQESCPDLGNPDLSLRQTPPKSTNYGLDGSHWDLLLELDCGSLLTWRLASLPTSLCARSIPQLPSTKADSATKADSSTKAASIPAIRLADHRAVYLDYEGPISGNRGSVSRKHAGYYVASLDLVEPMDRSGDTHAALDEKSAVQLQKLPIGELSSPKWLRVKLVGPTLQAEFQVACVPVEREVEMSFLSWSERVDLKQN